MKPCGMSSERVVLFSELYVLKLGMSCAVNNHNRLGRMWTLNFVGKSEVSLVTT
jgi:hypothetical protein